MSVHRVGIPGAARPSVPHTCAPSRTTSSQQGRVARHAAAVPHARIPATSTQCLPVVIPQAGGGANDLARALAAGHMTPLPQHPSAPARLRAVLAQLFAATAGEDHPSTVPVRQLEDAASLPTIAPYVGEVATLEQELGLMLRSWSNEQSDAAETTHDPLNGLAFGGSAVSDGGGELDAEARITSVPAAPIGGTGIRRRLRGIARRRAALQRHAISRAQLGWLAAMLGLPASISLVLWLLQRG